MYIMQQMVWNVKPNKETKPEYLKAYDHVFADKDVAEYYLNDASKTNEDIGIILNSINDRNLRNNVADTLNQIKLMYPSSTITTIRIIDGDTCMIVYDFITKVTVVDKITK